MKAEERRKKKSRSKTSVLAYRVLGGKIEGALPHFEDLHEYLRKAGIKIAFPAYVSMMVLFSIIGFAATTGYFYFLLKFIIKFPYPIPMSIGIGLLAFVAIFWGFYLYPSFVAARKRTRLESALPYAASHMAVLASAGIPPERLFKALAVTDSELHIQEEAAEIVRDVEVLGKDILTELDEKARRTYSKLFADLLSGFTATARAGGDLKKYLARQARNLMVHKRIMIRKTIETLSVMAEVYIAMLVAMPLVFSILLAVLSFVGGAGVNPLFFLNLLTYIAVPILSIMFLVLLDSFVHTEA